MKSEENPFLKLPPAFKMGKDEQRHFDRTELDALLGSVGSAAVHLYFDNQQAIEHHNGKSPTLILDMLTEQGELEKILLGHGVNPADVAQLFTTTYV